LRRLLALLVLALAAPSPPAAAQAFPFGASEDPMEAPPPSFTRSGGHAAAYAGPAYLGASWRAAVALDAEVHQGRLSAAFGGAFHTGDGGVYDAEADEPYDLARLVRYVRLEPSRRVPVYARLGPTTGVILGHGLLVRDYRSTTAWDERTVGAEVAVQSPGARLGAFTGDLRASGVVGAHAEVALAPGAASPLLHSFRLGLGAVHDLGVDEDRAPTAFEVSARAEVFRLMGLGLTPWAAYAQYLHYGRGAGFGADVGSAEVLGAARARLRLGVLVSGDRFTPGYVGPFYPVSNVEDRIVTASSFFEGDGPLAFADVPLGETEGGVDLLTEAELAAFRTVALSYHFRRHYGDQPLSDFALRLAFRPRFVEGLGVALAVERRGLRSFFSLFDDLEDQNTLVFDVDYPLAGAAHLSIRSRYGYRRLEDAADGTGRFLVQRRFEPFAGLRVRF
jgi:hypothetical protein